MKKLNGHQRIFNTLFLSIIFIFLISCSNSNKPAANTNAATKGGIPKGGELINDKTVGKGWINLIASLDNWNAAVPYWTLENGILHGDYTGGEFHNYAYTKTYYSDFELNAV